MFLVDQLQYHDELSKALLKWCSNNENVDKLQHFVSLLYRLLNQPFVASSIAQYRAQQSSRENLWSSFFTQRMSSSFISCWTEFLTGKTS